MINMSNKMSNIYAILIIIAVIIYTFFLKEQIYESFFGKKRRLAILQNTVLRNNKYHCQSYIDRYPDLQKAFGKRCKNINTKIKAQEHYLKYGIREGRNPRRPPVPPSPPVPVAPSSPPVPPGTQQPVKAEPEQISSLCKEQSIVTSRRLNEANTELRNARYKMESAFRNCSTLL